MTNGEFVSRVVNGLRNLNKDEHISKRYILRIGQNKSKFYISQKLLDKSLFRETNLFKTIPCLRMVEEETLTCGIHEFMRCDSLMRSMHKIPGLVYNRLGVSIISVTSINGDIVFKQATLNTYKNSTQRKYTNKLGTKFYYVQDNYIYLPDSEIEYITLTYIPFDDYGVDEISECEGINSGTISSGCSSIWDSEFRIPDKLSEQVITETIQEVSMTRKIVIDENPNLNQNEK